MADCALTRALTGRYGLVLQNSGTELREEASARSGHKDSRPSAQLIAVPRLSAPRRDLLHVFCFRRVINIIKFWASLTVSARACRHVHHAGHEKLERLIMPCLILIRILTRSRGYSGLETSARSANTISRRFMGNDTIRERITVSSVEAPLATRTRAVSASNSGTSQVKLGQKIYKQPLPELYQIYGRSCGFREHSA